MAGRSNSRISRHRLKVTGPIAELLSFADCFVRAKDELCFRINQLPIRPEDYDRLVVAKWDWVAGDTTIEVTPSEITVTWRTGVWVALVMYNELTKLFPRLSMRGCYEANNESAEVFRFDGAIADFDFPRILQADRDACLASMNDGTAEMSMKDARSTELVIRRAAGLKIDPDTAEVEWASIQMADHYGVRQLLSEDYCVGRGCFARAPGSDVWISLSDLPMEARNALWEKHKSKLAFTAGFDELAEAKQSGKQHQE